MQSSLRNLCTLRCYISARFFTTGNVLCRSLKKKDHRLPKGAPKRSNPFLIQYDRKGKPKRLERWNIMNYGDIPYEKGTVHEYGINPKDVHPTKLGGSLDLVKRIGEDVARFGYQPGYKNKDGKFVVVPEMIPEFVVPDLTDFELKPYVPYGIEDVNQSEFTARELFISTYGQKLVSQRKNMTPEQLDQYLEDFKKSSVKSEESSNSEKEIESIHEKTS